MSRGKKLMIGLLSFLPLIIAIIYFIQFFYFFRTMFEWSNNEPKPREFFRMFYPFILIGIFYLLAKIGNLVYFIIHSVNNKKIDEGERVVWIIVFVLIGTITFPIYWIMRIMNDKN